MTDTIVAYDPMSSTSALTREERSRLTQQPQWLADLLEEQVLARLLLAVTPSVTGKPIPS